MRFLRIVVCFSLIGLTFGCEAKPGATSKVSPAESFHAAFTQAVSATQKIRDALADGKPDAAHDELHDIGHLLQELPTLAKAAAIDKATSETVEKTAKGLFDVIDKVDAALHDGKEIKYDDVKEGLESGLAELKKLSESLKK
jgi:predicted translin family RNA/ssDNA-binding protein